MKFTDADREKLMQLAKLFNIRKAGSVTVPSEVLNGVSRTLEGIANREKRFTREAMHQMWSDPASRHMAAYCQRRYA